MTRLVRLVAATLTVVLALFPLAMERCRAVCATPTPAAQSDAASSSSAHACHETASGAADVVATPSPRTCGHSDEAGARDALTLAASRTRVALHVTAALPPADVMPVALEMRSFSPPGSSPPAARVAISRNLPLRL